MTPSQGSSIGVAYAPKTLSAFAPPSSVADLLSPPPQPDPPTTRTAARTTQHARRRPDIRIRLLEIVSRDGASLAPAPDGCKSAYRTPPDCDRPRDRLRMPG